MAEKKISQLPILSEVTGGAILPIVAGDTTYQVSVEELSGYTEELIRAIISGSNTYVGTQTYNGVINATNNLTVAGILSATEITTLNVYTSSFNNLQGFTSSLRNEVNGIEAYTASLKGTTLISGSAQISALGFSAATNGTVSSSAQITELPYIHSTTSSLNVFTGSVQSEVNALKIATSSYVVNSLTSSFVSYGILSQSFANFTSSVVNLHNDVNIISSSLVINSSGNFIRKQSTGDKDLQIRADSGVGISLTSNASLTWRIDTAGNIIPQGNYEIENNSGTKVFNSLAKIHTYTGSLRSEVNLIEAYTASLKGAIEVSGQNVNVLGMITAQQFNVTYVSSSTLYQSGSTKFGDTSDDRHEFTGSLNVTNGITGSINYNNLTNIPTLVSGSSQIFTGYDYEIHVSQIDGNDTTGNGDLLTPVASITKALTLVTGQRRTVIIHPGSYTESPSITTQYTVLTTFEPLGGNTAIIGTVSTSVGCTIVGLTIQNLTITAGTGVGVPNIINCNISGTLTKSGNATFTDIHNCDIGTACNITGTGLVTINDGNPNFVTVNNSSANVIIKNAMSCVAPSVTAGTLSITDSIVIAAVTNAVTSNASSIITLANSQFLTSALNAVAPVSLSGFYSIFNCVFDKPNSTLVGASGTGGSTNSIDYFQYINADKFITQGGTSNQFVKGDGSLDSVVPAITGSNTFIGNQTISGSLVVQNGVSGSFSGSFTGNGAGLTQVPSASIASDLYKPTGTISVGIGGDSNIIQISGSLIQLGNPTLYTETLVSRQLAVSGGITVHNTLGNGFYTVGVDNAGSAQIGANNNLNILLKNDGRSILYNGVEVSASISVQNNVEAVNLIGSLLSTNGVVSSSTQITNYHKFAETASANTFYGNQTLSGSLNVTGSVNIDNVIKLTPVTPFPNGQAGMLVASASYGFTNLYIYDGSEWKWLVTGSIQ